MTEDINNYSFDFGKEAEDLRQNLGRRCKRLLFVETEVIGDRNGGLPEINFYRLVGSPWLKKKRRLSKIYKSIVKERNKQPDGSSYQLRKRSMSGRAYSYISFRENAECAHYLGEANKSLMSLFSLYHETGHALLPKGPEIDEDHPLQEAAADAYAALRLLQRFGKEAVPILSMISWQRAQAAVFGDTAHLTTTVLDKIIADSATRDFSTLTPGETIKRAATYAKEWTPAASVLSEARNSFAIKEGNLLDFNLLASTCLSSPVNNFAFYIAAKVFQPYIHLGGITFNGTPVVLDLRRGYATPIEQRSNLNLYDVLNKAADRPAAEPRLAETLRVSLPSGQKQLDFQARQLS